MEVSDKKFDDLLSSLKTGKWNLYILSVVSLLYMQLPMFLLSGAFTVPNIPHTCIAAATPEEQYPGATITPLFANNTLALVNNTLDDDDEWSCSLPGEPGESSRSCTSWAFNNTVYGRTLTSEFELVCDRRFFRGLYNSVFFFGAVSGSSVSGWMSDRFGRKRVISLTVVGYAIIGAIISWIPNLTPIMALRFIMGLLHPFCVQISYSLVMEVFEERWRSTAGIIVFLPWCFGMMLMAGVSSVVRDWRWQNFYLSLPTLLLLPLIWMVDESPRWLIVRGRHAEAHKVLKKAARWNKTTLPSANDLRALMEDIRQESADTSATKREGRCHKLWECLEYFTLLLRTRRIRRITLVLFCVNFINSMGYIGLSLGGDLFSSDPYLYMAISGLVEILGATFTIPIVKRFGRRYSNMVFYFLTGACFLGLTVIPTRLGWLVMTLALLGKVTINTAYLILILHSGELFPTEVRTWGMGNAAMMDRIGSVFASFLVSALPSSWSAVPSIIFGCSCLFAAWATLLLPETHGAPLYDTVAAMEAARPSRGDEEQGEDVQEEEKQQPTTTTTTTTM